MRDDFEDGEGGGKNGHGAPQDASQEPMDQDQQPEGTGGRGSGRDQGSPRQEGADAELPNQVEELAQRYLNQ